MKEKNSLTIWDVLNEYADVRDNLEDILLSIEYLQDEIGDAIDTIAEEMVSLNSRLSACDRIFRRYKNPVSCNHDVMGDISNTLRDD